MYLMWLFVTLTTVANKQAKHSRERDRNLLYYLNQLTVKYN